MHYICIVFEILLVVTAMHSAFSISFGGISEL